MNTLIVHIDTTGPDPDINAVNSIGWVLLDDNLDTIRNGCALVQPWEGSIVDSKMDFVKVAATELCGQLIITEEEALDMLEHQTRGNPTLWASHDVIQTWMCYKSMLNREQRLVPRGIVTHLDLNSINYACLRHSSTDLSSKIADKIYEVRHSGLAMSSNDSLAAAMNDAIGYKQDMIIGNINGKENS